MHVKTLNRPGLKTLSSHIGDCQRLYGRYRLVAIATNVVDPELGHPQSWAGLTRNFRDIT